MILSYPARTEVGHSVMSDFTSPQRGEVNGSAWIKANKV